MAAAEVPAAAVQEDVLPAAALAEDLPSAVVPPSVEADVPPVSAAAVPAAAEVQEDAEDNIQCIKKAVSPKG